MKISLGGITAHLSDPEQNRVDDLVDLLNRNINPPDPVKPEDIEIRSMFIVSDEINSYGGRFPDDELRHVADLLIDSPVLIGHRKDKLPVGRTFHTELINHNDQKWVKSYFYWMKSADGSETLKENIDGGIYKECSIGFVFGLPECSVCGKDIRTCQHEPFVVYNSSESCFFYYRQVQKVLESSLVYRGAVANTKVSNQLGFPVSIPHTGAAEPLLSLEQLPEANQYLITPFYDTLSISLTSENNRTTIITEEHQQLNSTLINQFFPESLPDMHRYGQLIGFRGKERCSAEQLRLYLNKQQSDVSRLELKIYPDYSDPSTASRLYQTRAVRPIRFTVTGKKALPIVIPRYKTKDGVRLWPVDSLYPHHPGYHFSPEDTQNKKIIRIGKTNPNNCFLHLQSGFQNSFIRLNNFSFPRLLNGARFIAEPCPKQTHLQLTATQTLYHADTTVTESGSSLTFHTDRYRFTLHPVILNGQRKFLFSGQPLYSEKETT